ncbi:P-loop containing nucleoside triphosphate hydrolase protein [Ephemerocybe angulata]|uniref:P-loop containing nucleoside triphosphate hydrolase protein n=1 Tax=Ephemerocybe angulata TaxID=980116 RepID=A0A8H6I9V1_9AGAR|nr:P-loop containing nucleoside triphosphate hydrolase protein [Tulosesus angulatus]
MYVVKLCVYDTAGQEDYPRLRPMAYANAHVILICFAVDDPESLANVLDKWAKETAAERPKLPVLLVGCKGDRRARRRHSPRFPFRSKGRDSSSPELADQIRTMLPPQATTVAKEINARAYLECSAMTGDGVPDVFRLAAGLVNPAKTCTEEAGGVPAGLIQMLGLLTEVYSPYSF